MNCNDFLDSLYKDENQEQIKKHCKECSKCNSEKQFYETIESNLQNGYNTDKILETNFLLSTMEKIKTLDKKSHQANILYLSVGVFTTFISIIIMSISSHLNLFFSPFFNKLAPYIYIILGIVLLTCNFIAIFLKIEIFAKFFEKKLDKFS